MSKMNTKFKYMYDAAPEAALVPKDGVAKTASFNSNPLALDKILGYWNRTRAGALNTLADQTVAIAVNVTGIKRSVGDEAYALELEFGPAGLATSIKPQKLTVTQNGQYVFLVDIHTLKHMKSDIDVVRIAATLGGTAPSITLHSWLAGAIIQ